MTRPQHNDRRHAPNQELTREDPADTARLITEITSLRTQPAAARIKAANLEAAMRAALSAHSDGEPDPLSCLRDETGNCPGGAHGA